MPRINDGEDYELLFTIENKSFVGEFESEWNINRYPFDLHWKVVKRSEKDDLRSKNALSIDLTGYAHFGNP